MSLEAWAYKKRICDDPGPGTYSIPNSFGSGPKFSCRERPRVHHTHHFADPSMHLLPSTLVSRRTTFGGRTIPPRPEETPGPGDPRGPFLEGVPRVHFHFKRDISTDEVPAPTSYSVPRDFGTTPIRISSAPRTDLVDRQPRPPPGAYDVPGGLDTGHGKTIGVCLPLEAIESTSPGPGAYGAVKKGLGEDAPKYTFPKEPVQRIRSDVPGPADYDANLVDYKVSRKIPFLIEKKSRPDTFSAFVMEKSQQCGIVSGTTFVPKKLTIGSYFQRSDITPGPGPAYQTRSAFADRRVTIGKKTSIHERENCAPSPDHYFKIPFVVPKDDLLLGFSGPAEREPEEIKRKKWVPSPAKYKIKRDLDDPKKGFTIGNRCVHDYVPDNDAPYNELPSSLSGPKYTIGNRYDNIE